MGIKSAWHIQGRFQKSPIPQSLTVYSNLIRDDGSFDSLPLWDQEGVKIQKGDLFSVSFPLTLFVTRDGGEIECILCWK